MARAWRRVRKAFEFKGGCPFWIQAVEQKNQPKKEMERMLSWPLWRHTPEDPRIPTMPFIYCILNSKPGLGVF